MSSPAASRARNARQNGNTASPRTIGPVGAGDRSRLLGQVKLVAARFSKVESERERAIVRARAAGCSLREIADAAGFGSHHRVTELLGRASKADS